MNRHVCWQRKAMNKRKLRLQMLRLEVQKFISSRSPGVLNEAAHILLTSCALGAAKHACNAC